jgi:DNA-directed RNA polymerase subunit RPC12/RpoP
MNPEQPSNPVTRAKPTRDDLGLACPSCGCRHLPVWYTRQKPGYVLRVRLCRHCGRRVATRERL